ncbi:hypothetical protein QYF36_017002 [Acer negundo]|nr:hypothetical protein QYF36_017002 [Acer negundo]
MVLSLSLAFFITTSLQRGILHRHLHCQLIDFHFHSKWKVIGGSFRFIFFLRREDMELDDVVHTSILTLKEGYCSCIKG